MPQEPKMVPKAPIDTVKETNLRSMFDYWQRIRGERTMPARADFDPLDLPTLLKDLFLVEVHGREPEWRFRYRVAGTGISRFVGRDYTGQYVHELFQEPARSIVEEFYSTPVRLRMAVYSVTSMVVPGSKIPKRIARLIAPFSTDGHTVDMLLNCQHYEMSLGPRGNIPVREDYRLESIFAIDPG